MSAKYSHTALYTMNNLVEFFPVDRSLTNKETGKRIVLQCPASYILLYLLTHNGVIIPQSTLVTAGWGDKQSITTINTFYQTVLSLRNALTEVGLPRNLIKTIARRGIMITVDIHYSEKAMTAHQANLTSDSAKAPSATEESALSRRQGMLGIVLFIALVGVGITAGLFYSTTESLFASYNIVDAESISSCTLLLKGKGVLDTRYNQFMRRHPDICQNHNYVYLSGMHSAKNISAVACQMDIRKVPGTKCTTWYSINDEN